MIDRRWLSVRSSLGIACYPDHALAAETLLQKADIAMYAAKTQRVGVSVYEPSSDVHTHRRLSLIAELRKGLDEAQFFLEYQPMMHLRTNAIVGVEALVRWNHPQQGRVMPADFIDLAEQTGLINPLTTIVLETAIREWTPLQTTPPIAVSVNLSSRTLQDPRLPQRIAAMLDAYDAPPFCLALEIPENNGVHGLALPFHVELTRVAPLEEPLDRAMGGFVDEHRSGLGRGLQPRRDVHRVAERGVLDPRAGADLPDDDRAGRRSDPDAEALGTPAAPHFAGILLHLGDDAQRAENGSFGVVLPRGRRAEEGENSVAREILDVAAERLDLADDPGHRLSHDELHVLGVEPLCERGRADDVGEDGRQHLPLLPHGGGHTER